MDDDRAADTAAAVAPLIERHLRITDDTGAAAAPTAGDHPQWGDSMDYADAATAAAAKDKRRLQVDAIVAAEAAAEREIQSLPPIRVADAVEPTILERLRSGGLAAVATAADYEITHPWKIGTASEFPPECHYTPGSDAFIDACAHGDVDTARGVLHRAQLLHLRTGAPYDVHAYSNAALYGACLNGRVWMLHILMDEVGFTLDDVLAHNGCALTLAVRSGDCDTVSYLLCRLKGAGMPFDSRALFRVACELHHNDVARLLYTTLQLTHADVLAMDSKAALDWEADYRSRPQPLGGGIGAAAAAATTEYAAAQPPKIGGADCKFPPECHYTVGTDPFVDACARGEILQTLRGVDVHAYNNAALYGACLNGRAEVVDFLLTAGGCTTADVLADGAYALYLAIKSNNFETINCLSRRIYNLPDATATRADGHEAFRVACELHRKEMLDLLYTTLRPTHADVRAMGSMAALDWETAYRARMAAGTIGDFQPAPDAVSRSAFDDARALEHTLRAVETCGAAARLPFDDVITPLVEACRRGNVRAVDALLRHPKYTPEDARFDNCAPLRAVCEQDNDTLATLLLSKAAYTHDELLAAYPDCMLTACTGGHTPMVKFLLTSCGLSHEETLTELHTAFWAACTGGHTGTLVYLESVFHFTIEWIREDTNHALWAAAAFGHTGTIAHLVLAYGFTREDLCVPFAAACSRGRTATAREIWSYGLLTLGDICEDVGMPWATMQSALALAASGGHTDTVRFLVETCGVAREHILADEILERWLTYVCTHDHADVLRYLWTKYNLSAVDIGPELARRVFTLACTHGHATMVEFLWTALALQPAYLHHIDRVAVFAAVVEDHHDAVARFLYAHGIRHADLGLLKDNRDALAWERRFRVSQGMDV